MDNPGLDMYEKFSFMNNPKVRLAGALALGLIIGVGATWATMKTDTPRKSRAAVVEQRRVEAPVSPVQTHNTTSKPASTKKVSTKKVSLKVALKECNKITNKNKKAACIARTKKAYAKHTNSTTRRTSSVTPASKRRSA